MKIKYVTVTGADDSINPTDVFEISRQYPFVEWGILVSRGYSGYGNYRFPSAAWQDRLATLTREISSLTPKPRLSAHICGSWIRDLLMGKTDFFTEQHRWDIFSRIQFNFHGEKLNCDVNAFTKALNEVCQRFAGQFIFQFDGVNETLITAGRDAKADCAALFDLSHGAGILPEKWPLPLEKTLCGYAGGLSPENVAEQMRKLEPIVGDKTIWIDAETQLRSHRDSLFDLNKVTKFLNNAKEWTSNE